MACKLSDCGWTGVQARDSFISLLAQRCIAGNLNRLSEKPRRGNTLWGRCNEARPHLICRDYGAGDHRTTMEMPGPRHSLQGSAALHSRIEGQGCPILRPVADYLRLASHCHGGAREQTRFAWEWWMWCRYSVCPLIT